jgi:hypothetical protein
MKYLRLLLLSLSAGVLLMTVAFSSAVTAQDKQTNQTTDASKTTSTGFATGAKCTKSGTYRADNKYLRIIIVLEEGEEFPPFVDGEKTIWYELTPSTKSTFDPVKVSPGSN